MSSISYDVSKDALLPPRSQWQLAPFAHRRSELKILELLSVPPPSESSPSESSPSVASSTKGEGHVFRVRFEGHGEYALKVFKFYSAGKLRTSRFPKMNRHVEDSALVFESDPFFAECRAYGKIKSIEPQLAKLSKAKRPQRLAVPCHGYLALPASKFEKIFKEKFKISDWNRPESEYKAKASKRAPLRALVKELVKGERAVQKPHKMKRDLIKLRNAGILQMDVHARNYLGGLLVDFGMALTSPHWCFSQFDSDYVQRLYDQDGYDFDGMIRVQCPKSAVRMMQNFNYVKKLRSADIQDGDSTDWWR